VRSRPHKVGDDKYKKKARQGQADDYSLPVANQRSFSIYVTPPAFQQAGWLIK